METLLRSLVEKMDGLNSKSDEMSSKMDSMASKTDLVAMRQDITEDTKKSITATAGPIKTEASELRERLDLPIADLENRRH